MQVWSKRILPRVLTVAILAIAALPAAQAQSKDEITALNKRAVQLFGEDKYAEAVALAEKLLKAREHPRQADRPATAPPTPQPAPA